MSNLPYWPLTNQGVNDATKINADLAYLEAHGGGGISGSGTAGYLAKFSAATALTDSVLQEAGGIVGTTYAGNTGASFTYTGGPAVFLLASSVDGRVGTSSSHTFGISTNNTLRASFLSTGELRLTSLTAGGYVKAAGTTGQLSVQTGVPWADLTGAPTILSGSGTATYLTKWSAASAITNSIAYEKDTNIIAFNNIPLWAWDTSSTILNIGGNNILSGTTALGGSGFIMGVNVFYAGGHLNRISDGTLSIYYQHDGIHQWGAGAYDVAGSSWTASYSMGISLAGVLTITNLGTGYVKATSGALSSQTGVPYGDLTGVPSSFTPAAHRHYELYDSTLTNLALSSDASNTVTFTGHALFGTAAYDQYFPIRCKKNKSTYFENDCIAAAGVSVIQTTTTGTGVDGGNSTLSLSSYGAAIGGNLWGISRDKASEIFANHTSVLFIRTTRSDGTASQRIPIIFGQTSLGASEIVLAIDASGNTAITNKIYALNLTAGGYVKSTITTGELVVSSTLPWSDFGVHGVTAGYVPYASSTTAFTDSPLYRQSASIVLLGTNNNTLNNPSGGQPANLFVYATGASTNAQTYVRADNTNGIGSAQSAWQVYNNGTAGAAAAFFCVGSSDPGVYQGVNQADTVFFYGDGDGGFLISQGANAPLLFSVYDAVQMRIFSTGQFVFGKGITTTSYEYQFYNASTVRIDIKAAGTGENYAQTFWRNNNDDWVYLAKFSTSYPGSLYGVNYASSAFFCNLTGAWFFRNIPNEPILFSTNDTARLIITGGGNVGIGTTSPSAKLSINGGLHVGGDSDPGDNNLLVDGTGTITGAFACNGATARTAYASGGAVTTSAGTYGFASDAERASLTTLVANIRTALVNNGIMS
jgi:hypothetical protein